jgi:putative iron-only hydrogenase system regulator
VNQDTFWFNEGNGVLCHARLPSKSSRAFFIFFNERGDMERIAVIGAVLKNPAQTQRAFNEVVSAYKGIVKGRMGVPFDEEEIAVISITILGDLDDINALTGKLGNIEGVTVKTALSGELKK